MSFLWKLFYGFLSFKIWAGICILLPFWPRGNTRNLLKNRFWPTPLKRQPKAWFHAVSLGEAVILNAVLEGFSDSEKKHFLLTGSTQTGFDTLSSKNPHSEVRFMPFDAFMPLKWLFGSLTVPDLLIAETEIWPNLYRFVRKRGGRILLFNARFGPKTLKYQSNPLITESLGAVNLFLVRSSEEQSHLLKMSIPLEKILVRGNIKFDYCNPELPKNAFSDWLKSRPLIIFSSISNDEISSLAPGALALMKAHPDTNLLWVPRHFDQLKDHLKALAPLPPILKTQNTEYLGTCVILDTIGELSGSYKHGLISIIGGSFNQRGGQNFLESTAAGLPTIVGPNMHNFEEELNLALNEKAVIQVQNPDELLVESLKLLNNDTFRSDYRERALKFMDRNRGALAQTQKDIRAFLKMNESITL